MLNTRPKAVVVVDKPLDYAGVLDLVASTSSDADADAVPPSTASNSGSEVQEWNSESATAPLRAVQQFAVFDVVGPDFDAVGAV